jgi:ketopantoate reductase
MRILVYGAGVQGCELAHRLLQNKKKKYKVECLPGINQKNQNRTRNTAKIGTKKRNHVGYGNHCADQ